MAKNPRPARFHSTAKLPAKRGSFDYAQSFGERKACRPGSENQASFASPKSLVTRGKIQNILTCLGKPDKPRSFLMRLAQILAASAPPNTDRSNFIAIANGIAT
jgi:hypothetical protein